MYNIVFSRKKYRIPIYHKHEPIKFEERDTKSIDEFMKNSA